MCWQSLLPEEHLAPKIATDNFSVYKVLKKDGKTPVMEYPIKFNEPLPKVDVSPQTSEFIVNIEKVSFYFDGVQDSVKAMDWSLASDSSISVIGLQEEKDNGMTARKLIGKIY